MGSDNLEAERGRTTDTRSRVLVFSYFHALPFWTTGSERCEIALGGWQLSRVTTIHPGQRPNVVGDWKRGAGTQYGWCNQAAFTVPAAGTFGNFGRNVLTAPGHRIGDASLQKYFNFNENWKMQFRAEFSNAPNRLSWWGVAIQLSASNFGQITNATDPRNTPAWAAPHFLGAARLPAAVDRPRGRGAARTRYSLRIFSSNQGLSNCRFSSSI